MRVTITIDCDNAAFSDGALAYEVKRILAEAAAAIEGMTEGDEWPLHDINGNHVGSLEVT